MSELTKEQLLEYVKKQKLKMKKMETEIATLKEKSADPAPAVVSTSQDEITTLRTEIESLEKQLSRRDEEIASLSRTIEDAEDEKIKVVAQKNVEIASLTQQIETMKNEVSDNSSLLEEIGRLENGINAQRAEIETYSNAIKEIDSLRTQLSDALTKEAAAQAEVLNLNDSIDQIRMSAAQLNEGNQSYTTQIGEFESLIQDLKGKLTQFEAGDQALRTELHARETSANSANEQLSASLEIIVSLKESAEVQRAAQEESAAALMAAQSDLLAAREDLQSKSEELALITKRASDLDATIGSLKASNEESCAVLAAQLTSAQSEVQTARSELQSKIEALEEATERNRDLEAAMESLSKAPVVSEPVSPVVPAASPAPPALTAESLTTNGSKKKGKNNKKGKGGKASEGGAETESSEPIPEPTLTAGDVQTEVTKDSSQSDFLTARVQELEASLAEALEHRTSLEQTHATQLSALEGQLAQILASEQGAKVDSAALTTRLETLSAEWTASQAQAEALSARSVELEAERTRLQVELTDVTQQLRCATSVAQSSAQELQDEVRVLKEKHYELEAALEASVAREAALSQEKSSLSALLAASSDAEAFAQSLQGEIDALRVQRDELQVALKASAARESVVSEELVGTKATLSAQLTSLETLQAAHSALQGEYHTAQAERAQLEQSVALKDHHLLSLQTELDSLKRADDASQSESTTEIALLKEQAASLQAQVMEITAADTSKTEEIRQLKETGSLSESNNKKLLAKLKLKMKECADLNAELTTVKETATKSAIAEATSITLSDRIAALESSVKSVTAAKTELESRLKATNDTLIAGEERISSLLREKNKLQEDLFESLHKVEGSTKDAHTFKTERDLARQQYLDAETKLQALSASTRDKIDSLTAKMAEITAYNNSQAAQITTLNETLALSNSEITTLKENATNLSQTSAKLKSSSATVESLKQQLQECKADAETKAEAGAERIKKLKQLLAKVNAALQEKDLRLNQLQSANDRAKKFNIVSRIGIVPPQDSSGEELQWCLIYEHRAQGAQSTKSTDEDSSQYRWIEARVAHKWMAEGSTLVGAWPQPIQETWATELSTLKSRLESERDDLSSKYEEVSAQFQAYKVRAQTALKRIGNEDRNERQKVQEAENAEIEKLRGVVQDLRERENDFNAALSEKNSAIAHREEKISELRTEVEVLQNSLSDNAQAQQVSERRIAALQREIETLQEDAKSMKEQYEAADRNNRERRVQQLRLEEENALRAATKSNTNAGTETGTPVQRAATPLSATSEVQDSTMLDTSESTSLTSQVQPLSPIVTTGDLTASQLQPHGYALNSPMRGLSRETSLSTHNSVLSPRGRPSAVQAALVTDVNDASDNKLLLFQQADHVLRDSIAILRQENSQLMVEINELKNDFGLREDQVQALKDTVRELESSLCREKEFNAENRRINADYLVNILRNFLMSTEPSERAKLVPVLCQILHLGVEESRIIAEKWAVRTGGLVGWLMPPRPAAPSATPRYQQHATGMSIDRGDGNKSSGTDLTYDHSTGAGIDVNGY